jgi:hypothetical protein
MLQDQSVNSSSNKSSRHCATPKNTKTNTKATSTTITTTPTTPQGNNGRMVVWTKKLLRNVIFTSPPCTSFKTNDHTNDNNNHHDDVIHINTEQLQWEYDSRLYKLQQWKKEFQSLSNALKQQLQTVRLAQTALMAYT